MDVRLTLHQTEDKRKRKRKDETHRSATLTTTPSPRLRRRMVYPVLCQSITNLELRRWVTSWARRRVGIDGGFYSGWMLVSREERDGIDGMDAGLTWTMIISVRRVRRR